MNIEQDNKEAFVREYLVDYNPIKAAIRAGAPPLNAEGYAKAWLESPDVQILIHKKIDSSTIEELVPTNRLVAKLWEEAMTAPKCSTRSASLKELAIIRELHKEPERIPKEIVFRVTRATG